jgi:leucyl-tRNA synthetase
MNYISIQSLNDVIEHYGIKGMRWGIKSRSPVVRSEASQYKNMKALVKEMKKAGMVTKRQNKGYKLQFKAMRKHMSATKDRAVLSEMYDQASKSRGRAMTFNHTKAGRLRLVADAKDSRAERIRRKASEYMN